MYVLAPSVSELPESKLNITEGVGRKIFSVGS
jgi:hypothetical protein